MNKLIKTLILFTAPLSAQLPEGHKVVHGEAHVEKSFSKMEIKTSDTAILHWDSFNIGAGKEVQFVQPGSSSAVLNRVEGKNPSAIYGKLQANGKVYLINPQGIIVGPEGVIKAAHIALSTKDISTEHFLKQKEELFTNKNREEGALTILGSLEADTGNVTLISKQISQGKTSQILAKKATVVLAAGDEILLIPGDDPKILIRPDLSELQQEEGIDQQGRIVALQVKLAAKGSPYQLAINQKGQITALEKEEKGGKIRLVASKGEAEVSGQLIATGEKGGEISLEAENLHLKKALLDASGKKGGGLIDTRGSQTLTMDKETRAKADSLEVGKGGDIFLVAKKRAAIDGIASVKGGALGGDGGSVEVSADDLNFKGSTDRSAPFGAQGHILIDPIDVLITDNDAKGTITVGQILSELQYGNVTIQSSGAPGSEAGDIILYNPNNAFNYDGSNTLTLSTQVPGVSSGDIIFFENAIGIAYDEGYAFTGNVALQASGDIDLYAPIVVNGPASVSLNAAGSIYLYTNSDDPYLGSYILTENGSSTLIAGNDINLANPSNLFPMIGAYGSGNITFVVDNNNPSQVYNGVLTSNSPHPPNLGTGALITGSNSGVYTSGGQILIYSSDQGNEFDVTGQSFLPLMQGPFNGYVYNTPTKPFLDTSTVEWGVYYPQTVPNTGSPVTIFYKTGLPPTNYITQLVQVNQGIVATQTGNYFREMVTQLSVVKEMRLIHKAYSPWLVPYAYPPIQGYSWTSCPSDAACRTDGTMKLNQVRMF